MHARFLLFLSLFGAVFAEELDVDDEAIADAEAASAAEMSDEEYEAFSNFFANIRLIFSNFQRPFSAVSTPKFARKYAFESSRRDLQDVHAFAPLRPHYSRKFSSNFSAFFGKLWQFSANFYKKPSFLTKI